MDRIQPLRIMAGHLSDVDVSISFSVLPDLNLIAFLMESMDVYIFDTKIIIWSIVSLIVSFITSCGHKINLINVNLNFATSWQLEIKRQCIVALLAIHLQIENSLYLWLFNMLPEMTL